MINMVFKRMKDNKLQGLIQYNNNDAYNNNIYLLLKLSKYTKNIQ